MKKIIFFFSLMLIAAFGINAQPPQGVNYQGVAYGPGGPLSNHPVSFRLSILDSSSSGTVVYVETQNTTTDTTGLFSVVIGMGTPVTGTFSSISWGANNKWLKTEIDSSGGSNYLVIGVSQFMSVPYALFAGKCSTCCSVSVEYPDGTDSITPVFLSYNSNYTVPAGKNLYISSMNGSNTFIANASNTFILINGDTLSTLSLQQYQFPLTFAPGTNIQTDSFALIGFLVNQKVTWLYLDPVSTPYTVPSGKVFFIKQFCWHYTNYFSQTDNIIIDGTYLGNPIWINNTFPIVLDQSQTISYSTIQGTNVRIFGYLKNR